VHIFAGYRKYGNATPQGNSLGAKVGLKYGLQRRIGNIGYIEGFAGFNLTYLDIQAFSYNQNGFELQPNIGIKAGFAIDSFKNLRRMLKD
jgi:hypothetical protein